MNDDILMSELALCDVQIRALTIYRKKLVTQILGYSPDEKEEFVLKLGRYQRDNLFWLFQVCQEIEPFVFAQTGDWFGEIPRQLGAESGRPNLSLEDMKKLVIGWVQKQKAGDEE